MILEAKLREWDGSLILKYRINTADKNFLINVLKEITEKCGVTCRFENHKWDNKIRTFIQGENDDLKKVGELLNKQREEDKEKIKNLFNKQQ